MELSERLFATFGSAGFKLALEFLVEFRQAKAELGCDVVFRHADGGKLANAELLVGRRESFIAHKIPQRQSALNVSAASR